MTRRLALPGVLAACLLLGLLAAGPAAAASPEWQVTVAPSVDYFAPGPADHDPLYFVEVKNVGEAPSSGTLHIKDTLPAGLGAVGVRFRRLSRSIVGDGTDLAKAPYEACPSLLECRYPYGPEAASLPPLQPGEWLLMTIQVSIPEGASGPLEDSAKVTGGGALAAEASVTNAADPEPPFGLHGLKVVAADSAAQPYTEAGGHPFQLTTQFGLDTETTRESIEDAVFSAPVRDGRDLTTELPPGLIGNPQAVPSCSLAEFFAQVCEPKAQVGVIEPRFGAAIGRASDVDPLYNLQPAGAYPGELGYTVAGLPFLLVATLRSGSDYGLDITSLNTPRPFPPLIGAYLSTWGVPAEEAHHLLRGKACAPLPDSLTLSGEDDELICGEREGFGAYGDEHGSPAGAPEVPFLRMPTGCTGEPLAFTERADSWQFPESYAQIPAAAEAVGGCDALRFEPAIEARPTTNRADSPSGLEFDLHVPQGCWQPPESAGHEALCQSDLHEAVVRLPQGLSVNPSSGNGLGSCSPEQIGLKTAVGETPAHFTEEPSRCPDAAKLGTAEVKTPLLHVPLQGSVYLATPHQNPFDSLLAAYIVLEGEGLIIKLPGKIEADPVTGQLTGRFLENPQTPFEDFHLDFFGGAKGDLRTPAVCGEYKTTTTLTPYSAPESGPPAEPSSSFDLENGGAACAASASQLPNKPVFRAGTESPQAAAYSPFSLRLSREDGSQEFSKIETTLPPGLTGKLAGVAECSEADLAVAQSREHEGGGAEEQASPACPASSEVGTVEVGAGVGPTPLYVSGHAYLAGPYKGAPLSLAIITPAVAGPFDLGDVVVRTALFVDPETARIKAVSDPIPHILDGIPLDVRSVTLKMARPDFTLNPTNCSEFHLEGTETSVGGNVAHLSQRFQVGNCAALPFKPKLNISLKGSTKHAGHPGLKAVLTYPKGGPYANVASAQVNLPHSEFIDQGNLNKTCTKPVLLAGNCPATSIYGKATAWTPLLEKPLEGPVYLVGGYGYKLPALVAELNGQIRVLLVGKVDSGPNKGIRNTFEAVPDAPVEKFVLEMKGGPKYSLLENSENLCAKPQKAIASFTAQNGKVLELHPTVANDCGKKKHKKHGQGHGKSGHHGGRGTSRSRALSALLPRGW